MNTTCPRCGAQTDASSRFCTNCGAILEQGHYRQSWESPQDAVPPWATANSGGSGYQQQYWGGQGTQMQGSLGFGGPNDALAKKLLTILAATVLGTIVLLLVFGVLAAFIPGFRCLFFLLIFLIILIPWIIYVNIRRYVRRTVGRLWWFL